MSDKRLLRTLALLLMIGLITIGLASCKLPASTGPQTTSETSDGFPVPGGTKTTNQIDISTFATQTAQARPPLGVSTPTANPYPITTSPNPTATSSIPSPVATTAPEEPSPTPQTIVYVTATPGGPPETYTLQEGEFPFCIARRFDVNLDELLSLNNLEPDTLLSPGDELKIPQTGDPFVGNRILHEHPTTYKIQEGDTLNKIACYFGDVSPDMIALQNGLKSNTDLPVGETLIIP